MLKRKFRESNELMVINLLYLGDLIFCLPLLAEIKQQRPQLKLSLVANDNFASLLSEAGFIDELFAFNKSDDLLSAVKTARFLRQKNYSLSLNIHGNWRSTILQRIACPGYRAGFDRSGQKLLLHFSRSWQPENMHMVDYQLQWLKELGLEVPETMQLPEVKPTSEAVTDVKSFLAENLAGSAGENYLILNTGGSWSSKRWPSKKFAELGSLILNNTQVGLVLTGSEIDRERNNKIVKEILHINSSNISEARIFNSAGWTSIPQLLALIKNAEVVVSGDTGPVHIAALARTPLIALFGPSDEQNYRPYRWDDHTGVITNNSVECRPCEEHSCPVEHHKCMKNISVETVWQELKKMLF